MFVRKASIATAAALLLATSGAAIAAPAKEAASVDVAYADLDLSNASGERRLKSRVRMAATRVCGNPGSHGLQAMRKFEDCRSAAIAAASQDISRVVAAARGTGPALASSGGGSIRVSSSVAEK